MKKALLLALAVSVLLLSARYVLIRTNGIQLSYQQFIEKAGAQDSIGSMFLLAYDGHRNGKVYLRSWEMNRIPRQITYWTKLDSFPSHPKNQVLNGTGRWVVEIRPHPDHRNSSGKFAPGPSTPTVPPQ